LANQVHWGTFTVHTNFGFIRLCFQVSKPVQYTDELVTFWTENWQTRYTGERSRFTQILVLYAFVFKLVSRYSTQMNGQMGKTLI